MITNLNSKETIRVLLIMGNNDSKFNTTYITALDGQKVYKGFNWDIWSEIQERLGNKYNFEIYESDKTKNYDIFVNEIRDGKYDIAISGFTHLSTRQDVKICIPHAITSNAIVYKHKPELIEDFKDIVGTLLTVLLYLVIIGLFFGLILYFFDPTRRLHSERLKKNDSLFFLRSILTGIASVYGEMGYLAERSSLKISGVLISVVIMSICFILVMYFQAEITKIMLTRDNKAINHYNAAKFKLLGHKDNSDALKVKRYGAEVDFMEDKTSEELLRHYLNNTDKYDGCIMPYHEAFIFVEKNSYLQYSADFGNEPCSFIVNKEKDTFYHDVNTEIAHLREEKRIQKICISYFGDIQHIPMCSLT